MRKIYTIFSLITIVVLGSQIFLIPTSMAESTQEQDAAQQSTTTLETFRKRILVKVNGQPITGGMFGAYLTGRMQKNPRIKSSPQLQRIVLNDLVNLVLLAQIAQNNNLEDRPQVATALDLQRKELLSQIALQEHLKQNIPSEDSLKQEYAELYAAPTHQYKAAHILVKTEAEAKTIITKLGQGIEFAALAKKESIDSNADQGGSLGWFDPSQMVKKFADAVVAMEIGATSTTPIKTQFGWHIIKLEDKRTQPPPTYEAVRPTILEQAQRRTLTNYLNQLRSQAQIEIIH